MAYVELKNIDVSYDNKRKVLDNLNLSIEEGELVSFLGPSGCGKTTTLRVIGGFIEPNAGEFILNNKNYTKIPIHKRNFGIVFQSYALFPHLTVFDNIAFGLKMRKKSTSEIKKAVDEAIVLVDLLGLQDRYPKELSGGQRQRVALARALVINPEILLLDEPLSNLDAKLRLKMRVEIRELQQKMDITSVFVTHDQEECFSISDKVAVMNNGIIEQYDRPENIYTRPKTKFVAKFVGFENFFDLNYTNGNYYCGNTLFAIENQEDTTKRTGTIRPEDIIILNKDDSPNQNVIKGDILVRTYLGKSYQYKIKTDFGDLIATSSNEKIYETGESLRLYLPESKLVVV